MEKLDIEKFDPTVAELHKIAADARAIVVTDINDKAQLDAVSDKRKELKAVRVKITATGKQLRADAISFQKAVIEKERDLVAIIEPEEERLQQIEKDIEAKKEAERMALLLPVRRKRIEDIGYKQYRHTDAELNAMSVDEFEKAFVNMQKFVNEETAKKLAEDRAKVDADQKKLDDEASAREREEQARKDERERIEREAKEKIEREAREAAAKVLREAEEKAAREKAEKFQKFLAGHGVNEESAKEFEQKHFPDRIELWRKVAVYKD